MASSACIKNLAKGDDCGWLFAHAALSYASSPTPRPRSQSVFRSPAKPLACDTRVEVAGKREDDG